MQEFLNHSGWQALSRALGARDPNQPELLNHLNFLAS